MRYPALNTGAVSPQEAAQNAIRAYCGWHIAPIVVETLTLDGDGSHRLALPSNIVHEVQSLSVDGVSVTDFWFSQDGWLHLNEPQVFPARPGSVKVTLKHGHEYVPEVTQVLNSFAQRMALAPAGNITSQRAGTQYVSFGTRDGEVTGGSLLSTEKELLAPYRLWSTPC